MELIKSNREHIEVLDGLRGLAIVLVLFAHFVREDFLIKHFPFTGPIITKLSLMGLTGVSLFFILSGFLITGILLNAKNKPDYFRNFYARRILRIFPLYYLSLFLVFMILPSVIDFTAQSTFLKNSQIWLWTYMSNFPTVAGIWNKSEQFALGHFWSLSVEEHFYLIWPLVIYLTDIKKLKIICKVIIVLSLLSGLISTLLIANYVTLKFFTWTTITFSGALAIGALLAVHKHEHGSLLEISKISKYLLSVFGILFLIIGFIPRRYNPELRGLIEHQISWFLYAGLMISIINMNSTSFSYKIFTNRLLLVLGKISYGIYVFHGILMPFFEKQINIEFISNNVGSPMLGLFIYYIVTIGIVFILAWISWTVFESQVLKLKSFFA
jgi:peptidoglycan/LPS O-acetylase OafA/YrhL